MSLPYPTKVVLPFDIATAQDMNERHANDVALANGTGLNDGAVTANKIDSATYSTTEKAVGTWINGKTIYRKTFTGTSLSSTSTLSIPHGVTTLDLVIDIEGSVLAVPATNQYRMIGRNFDDSNEALYIRADSTSVFVNAYGSINQGKSFIVTICYTKV